MRQRILTLRQIYNEGKELLDEAGISEASIDAWYLLEFVTGITKASYYGEPEKQIDEKVARRYFEYIQQRKKRIPLQHITGEQEFMGYSFLVNEHVLIPRQDTEVLVEEALKILRPGMDILDMCTGSGCILLSILKIGKEKKNIPALTGTGSDISEKALETACRNAGRLKEEARFVLSDLFEKIEGKFDLIVSNPPYIQTAVIEKLQEEVRLHDPYIALDGKEDGLYYYRHIISDSVSYMNPGGVLIFEIGYDQGKEVSALMEEAGYKGITIKKDLAGLDRVVIGMYNEK